MGRRDTGAHGFAPAGRVTLAVAIASLCGACAPRCVDPDALPSADRYADGCSEDQECISVRSNGCGHGCDCPVVIAAARQEEYERDVSDVEICCAPEDDTKVCDCALVTPACVGGLCTNAAE